MSARLAKSYEKQFHELRQARHDLEATERKLRQIHQIAITRHTFTSPADHAEKLTLTLGQIAKLSEEP